MLRGGGVYVSRKNLCFLLSLWVILAIMPFFSPKFENFRVFFSNVPFGAGAARFEIGAGSEQVQRGFGAGAAM